MTPDIKRAAFSSSRRSSQHKIERSGNFSLTTHGDFIPDQTFTFYHALYFDDRAKFFENYPLDARNTEQEQVAEPETKDAAVTPEVDSNQEATAETHAELEPQKTASKPFFFTSVKERRKLFL